MKLRILKIWHRLRCYFGAFVYLPLLTLFLSTWIILLLLVGAPAERVHYVVQLWGRKTCWIFRVRVRIRNQQLWPKDQSFVLLFNHSSFFDIFAILYYFPQTRFAAKKELFSIPVLGFVMRKVGVVSIDRRDSRGAIEAINAVLPQMGEKRVLAFAPEGTRNNGHELLPFKSGPFVFALKAQVQLLPVVVHGAGLAWPAHSWVPNSRVEPWQVELEVLDPLKTQGLTIHSKPQLMEHARALFEKHLGLSHNP